MAGKIKKIASIILSATIAFPMLGGFTTTYAAETTPSFVNGDFEAALDADDKGWGYWSDSDSNTFSQSEWAKRSDANGWAIWFYADGEASLWQAVNLEPGVYELSGYAKDTNGRENTIGFYKDNTPLGEAVTINDKNNFTEFKGEIDLSSASDTTEYWITVKISGKEGAWLCMDDFSITKKTSDTDPADSTGSDNTGSNETTSNDDSEGTIVLTPSESDYVLSTINVTPVSGLRSNFIRGVDVSSLISEFESGVKFYDFDGNEITTVEGFCSLLKSAGVTHLRIRVWNDPYNAQGNGYGGGNNDVAKAKIFVDACRATGLKALIDFHCSDFWTDPAKQMVPKAWRNYSLAEKEAALKAFITESLNTIDPSKDTVDMVQVGNETTTAFIGEKNIANMCKLFSAGSAGVREYNSSVKVVIHETNPEKGMFTQWAENLSNYNVDYDVLATSCYPYWHGTQANLTSIFNYVRTTYGKDVMVAETSYAYTLENSDGHANTVRVGNNDTNINSDEAFTVQGQANQIRNMINAVKDGGGIGLFYWEPAWITVGDTTGLTGSEYDAKVNSNKSLWESKGSGWASSYSAEYDSADAGLWYGGSAVDNEAMFDSTGHPLASLNVWKYIFTGAKSTLVSIDEYDSVIAGKKTITETSESVDMPSTVNVKYNNGSVGENVEWDSNILTKIDTTVYGIYTIPGTVTLSKVVNDGSYSGMTTLPVTYKLSIVPENLVDAAASEFNSGSNFEKSGEALKSIPSSENPYSGNSSMSWWLGSATQSVVTYKKPIEISAGAYKASIKTEGKAGELVKLQIIDESDNVLAQSAATTLTGWNEWKDIVVNYTANETKSLRLRIVVDTLADGWGSADCLEFSKAIELREIDVNAPAQSTAQSTSETVSTPVTTVTVDTNTETVSTTTPDSGTGSVGTTDTVSTNDSTELDDKTDGDTNKTDEKDDSKTTVITDDNGKVTTITKDEENGITTTVTVEKTDKKEVVTSKIEDENGKVLKVETKETVTKKSGETVTTSKVENFDGSSKYHKEVEKANGSSSIVDRVVKANGTVTIQTKKSTASGKTTTVKYKVVKGGVQVTAISSDNKKVTVPTTITVEGKKYKVVSVSKKVAKKNGSLKKIVLGGKVMILRK